MLLLLLLLLLLLPNAQKFLMLLELFPLLILLGSDGLPVCLRALLDPLINFPSILLLLLSLRFLLLLLQFLQMAVCLLLPLLKTLRLSFSSCLYFILPPLLKKLASLDVYL